MNAASVKNFAARKEAFETALATCFGSLDRSHYPQSLFDLLERVLQPWHPLRGLPLLAGAAAQDLDKSVTQDTLVALEMLFRGYLLQSELILEGAERTQGGTSTELRTCCTPAQILLAADTLFTLPFEVLARGGHARPIERLADSFGPDGVLGALDCAGAGFEDFVELDPLRPLIQAALGVDTVGGDWFPELSRYVFLREAQDWFGREDELHDSLEVAGRRLDELADLCGDSPPTALAQLFEYMVKP